eukprot:3511024-Amphidinium_carterae.1
MIAWSLCGAFNPSPSPRLWDARNVVILRTAKCSRNSMEKLGNIESGSSVMNCSMVAKAFGGAEGMRRSIGIATADICSGLAL